MEYEDFLHEYAADQTWDSGPLGLKNGIPQLSDPVQRPSHYTAGRQEAIDTIEDAVAASGCAVSGFLHGQVLKYLLRLWLKDDPLQDARKARWYLERLIASLEEP